jgi:hypothetical protein
MAHIFRTITVVIVLTATSAVVAGSGFPSADYSLSGVGQSGSPDIEARMQLSTAVAQTAPGIGALTDDEQAMVDWAKDRFAQAGLELPELTVRFDPSRALCGNSEGLYHHEPNGDRVVSICTRESDTFAAQLERRRTLLHEFGHAWDVANLADDDHDQLGRILGADAWNDHDDVWADRGVERFAETFVFALLDQPARRLKVDLECGDLLSAFAAATGAQPLGPGQPPCAV